MSLNQPITAFMCAALHTVSKTDRLSRVRALMVDHDLHHVPVVEGDRIVGLVSSTDLLSLGFGSDLGSGSSLLDLVDERYPIPEVMQRNLVTIGAHGTLADAARMLSTGRYHALPVVNADGELLGMLTSTDLIDHLAELLSG